MATLRRRSELFLGGADVQMPWRAAAAAGGGLDPIWVCSCVLGPGGLLRRRAGLSPLLLPAGGVGAAGLARIMAAVL